MTLMRRDWVPEGCETYIQSLASDVADDSTTVEAQINALTTENLTIHEAECFNLNPAANWSSPNEVVRLMG